MSDGYNPLDNAFRCHSVAIAALREINIRRGNILPQPGDETEERWAKEGEVPVPKLESGRVSV